MASQHRRAFPVFKLSGEMIPLWVVEVQHRRYLARYGETWPTYQHIKRRQLRRVEAYLKAGSLTVAAQGLRVFRIGAEIVAIRRAVQTMLNAMKRLDHGAEWPSGPDPLLTRTEKPPEELSLRGPW